MVLLLLVTGLGVLVWFVQFGVRLVWWLLFHCSLSVCLGLKEFFWHFDRSKDLVLTQQGS